MYIGLGRGQKCAHADVDHQTALNVVHNFSSHVGFIAVGFFDLAPHAATAHALVREQYVPILAVARALNFNRLPSLQWEWAIQFSEFLRRDQPLGLAT